MNFRNFSLIEWLVWLAIVCIVGLLLLGVWQHIDSLSLKHGTIVDKRHEAAYVDGHQVGDVWVTDYHEAKWTIIMEGEDAKGKFKRRKVPVSSGIYDERKIGESFTAP